MSLHSETLAMTCDIKSAQSLNLLRKKKVMGDFDQVNPPLEKMKRMNVDPLKLIKLNEQK